MQEIFQALPHDVQAVVVSATLSPAVMHIIDTFLRAPTRILIPQEEISLKMLKQYYVDCEQAEFKFEVMCDLFTALSVSKTVIFCNSRAAADKLHNQLTQEDFAVSVSLSPV